ncbi:protein giant-like isoform X1 [Prorops nasuta]|uniref:protein giant-like isoform X1 n=1 Tax=Prorops nasuta TaxID=863751 RepID=UPI0034CF350C
MENQGLDYAHFKTNGQLEEEETGHESPVLDLSFKKQPSVISESTNESFDSHLDSLGNNNDQHGNCQFLDSERKSPFEGRTFMVTPPSESDSPKKTKYESICRRNVSGTTIPSSEQPAFLSMTIPISAMPSVLPTLLAQSPDIKQSQITDAMATSTTSNYPIETELCSLESAKKAPRPFKAYPKDPLSLSMGPVELMYDQSSNDAYSKFRKRMLESVRKTNEGTNIKMRRVTKSPSLPTSTVDEKDAAYWERRRKNNEAAKRSRDARRAKEDEIAIRAAFLEQENIKLKYELVALRNETAKLRCMVYST